MNRPIAHRVVRLEQFAESQRCPIRERIERVMLRLGVHLPPPEVEEIVTRYVGVPARVRQLRQAGLSEERIIDRLTREMTIGEAG